MNDSVCKNQKLTNNKKAPSFQMRLVYWWRRGESNSRPQVFRHWLYMLIHVILFNQQLPDGQGRLMAIPDKF
jgi:hypothetical protein